MTARAQNWNLESFLDSLILELDKAQDTLSLKGVTRKLTYTVQDVALDLQIFPQYDKGKIRFSTAQPGDTGSSRLSIKLGSITDRQIRETTRDPLSVSDVSIDAIEEIDEDTRESLQKVGIHSAGDLERLEKRNVDVEKVVKNKAGSGKSYKTLANLINKARRSRVPPSISAIQSRTTERSTELELSGENLAIAKEISEFPMAAINDRPVDIIAATRSSITLDVDPSILHEGSNKLQVALDPYALMVLNVNV